MGTSVPTVPWMLLSNVWATQELTPTEHRRRPAQLSRLDLPVDDARPARGDRRQGRKLQRAGDADGASGSRGQRGSGLGTRRIWVPLPVLRPPRCVASRSSRFWCEIRTAPLKRSDEGLRVRPWPWEPGLLGVSLTSSTHQPWDPV